MAEMPTEAPKRPSRFPSAEGREYSQKRSKGRRRSPSPPASSSPRRLRLLYFALAAVWGYLVGAGGLAVALSASGAAAKPEGAWFWLFVPAAALAILGGAVTATAYREARRRFR